MGARIHSTETTTQSQQSERYACATQKVMLIKLLAVHLVFETVPARCSCAWHLGEVVNGMLAPHCATSVRSDIVAIVVNFSIEPAHRIVVVVTVNAAGRFT